MSFRGRLLVAFLLVVLVPVLTLAVAIRREMKERLLAQYQDRVDSLVEVIQADIAAQGDAISQRLHALVLALEQDNQFRLGAVAGEAGARRYVLDYSARALGLAGLDMLQVQDEAGRILSSGHFRNEFGLPEPGLVRALESSPQGSAIVTARSVGGPFLALARTESFAVGSRTFHLVAGTRVDEAFLRRLARGGDLVVSLDYPGGSLTSSGASREGSIPAVASPAASSSPPATGSLPASLHEPGRDRGASDVVVGEVSVPFLAAAADATTPATLRVTHPLAPFVALRRNIDLWFFAVAAGTAGAALLLAGWLSSRVSRPLRDLARRTAEVDLDRLDVDFPSHGRDEVGALARLLDEMTRRLRTSAARLVEAERRATIGEVARQVNHDIKNGLAPLRNVLRHLSQVAGERPHELASRFYERRGTLDSGLSYLETLATRYARLSPPRINRRFHVNGVVDEVARSVRGRGGLNLELALARDLPAIEGDPLALRRVLENLLANAVDSLRSPQGRLRITSEPVHNGPRPSAVRLTVADDGCGMTARECEEVFQDFYTTKEGGTGLGLSIVRRLVMDLHGSIQVESEPGVGTRFTVELPAAAPGPGDVGTPPGAGS